VLAAAPAKFLLKGAAPAPQRRLPPVSPQVPALAKAEQQQQKPTQPVEAVAVPRSTRK
jgi:hypothetical protein